jgi:hypothetical protein
MDINFVSQIKLARSFSSKLNYILAIRVDRLMLAIGVYRFILALD